MGQAYEKEMNVPIADPIDNLPNCSVPYFLVGREAFALKKWMLRPYSGRDLSNGQKILNYCLSRAHMVIENTFGIPVARWQIFHHSIEASVETGECMIKAAVCLHNYIKLTSNASYCPVGFVDCQDSTVQIKTGEWRSILNHVQEGAMSSFSCCKGTRYPKSEVDLRELMKSYVNSKHGAVPWQIIHVCGHA